MRPILYSFRRCPYAIRARIALYYSGVQCELREVVLKSKPPALLSISQKATVPVMLLNNQASGDARLIEESIEIVEWALSQSDPDGWLDYSIEHELIKECDDRFKYKSIILIKHVTFYLSLSRLCKTLVIFIHPK